jgi:hypothetical protein
VAREGELGRRVGTGVFEGGRGELHDRVRSASPILKSVLHRGAVHLMVQFIDGPVGLPHDSAVHRGQRDVAAAVEHASRPAVRAARPSKRYESSTLGAVTDTWNPPETSRKPPESPIIAGEAGFIIRCGAALQVSGYLAALS